jgi:hypothetical protein
MAVAVRGRSGFVAADARRGSVSVGAREIPFRDLAAVEVGYSGGDADTAAAYAVSLDLRGGRGESLELASGEESFAEARRIAVDFARECGVPIRDRSLGDPIDRTADEWSTTFLERHRHAPPPRPSPTPPGEELTFDVSGTTMRFHARPGSFRRMWRRPAGGSKATPLQWVAGIVLLPILLALFIPLIPFIAVAFAVVHYRTGGKGPILEASTEGVCHKRLGDERIPAHEIVDIEVASTTRPGGTEPAASVVIRSDAARVSYDCSGASAEELAWVRDWVRAIVAGG